MSNLVINDSNRDDVQSKYVDYLISRMDFMQIRDDLREYINTEKIFYSHDDLLDEIRAKGREAWSEIFRY